MENSGLPETRYGHSHLGGIFGQLLSISQLPLP